jgi:hypothetical protein
MEDILQMAAQMVDIQPLNRALGENIYLELTEWNGSKRVDLRFWKDGTAPTKEGVSLHLDQWKALCNMSDVIDDLLTRVIEKEPVEWRYHIGNDVFVTIKVVVSVVVVLVVLSVVSVVVVMVVVVVAAAGGTDDLFHVYFFYVST